MAGPSSRLWSPTVSTPSSGSPAPTTWRSTPSCPATASGTSRPGTSRAPAMPRTATPGSPGVPGCVSPRPGRPSSTPPRPPRSPTRTRCRCCSSRRGCRSVTPGVGNGLLHELKDQRGALDAILAYSHRVTSVAEIPLAVAQAFVTMSEGRPRPVHLEVPLDLLESEADVDLVRPLAAAVRTPAPHPCTRRPSAARRRSDPSWSSGAGLARPPRRCAPWPSTSAPRS